MWIVYCHEVQGDRADFSKKRTLHWDCSLITKYSGQSFQTLEADGESVLD